MMKPVTGQYECVHHSGVGLDYFTSRIDRLVLQSNGRFTLTVQGRSRVANAAQSLVNGQQITTAAPETRLEGGYTLQNRAVTLHFDNGGVEQAQLAPNDDGLQVGPNFFTKISDSTVLPPPGRMKQDMDDIAKGLKIASTIGGMALKAAKTVQGTIQSIQGSETTPPSQPPQSASPVQPTPLYNAPNPPRAGQTVPPAGQAAPNPVPQAPPTPQGYAGTLFCDQCGERTRPGKRFCNNCGARLA